jgi:hypothetical protein
MHGISYDSCKTQYCLFVYKPSPRPSHFLYGSDIRFIFFIWSSSNLVLLFGIETVRSMIQFSNPLILFLSILNRSVRLLLFLVTICFFYDVGFIAPRPTPNLEDQASVFMSPGDRVAQLYPLAPAFPFSRLLRHAGIWWGYSSPPPHGVQLLLVRSN